MSFQLARALKAGRQPEAAPPSRDRILASLLDKRAAAARAGLSDLERLLRSQILWALPIQQHPAESAEAEEPTPDAKPQE